MSRGEGGLQQAKRPNKSPTVKTKLPYELQAPKSGSFVTSLSNADIEVTLKQSSAEPNLRTSSFKKMKMLPWVNDERSDSVQTEFIHMLAKMDSRQRLKASKHAIIAATALLRQSRSVRRDRGKEEERRRVAWHEQGN